MTTTQEIDLYNLLAPKLGENEAKVLVTTFFNQHQELRQDVTKLQETVKNTSTKEEIARVQERQKELATKTDLATEIGNLRAEMKDSTNRLIMWMVGILIIQSGFMFALKVFG